MAESKYKWMNELFLKGYTFIIAGRLVTSTKIDDATGCIWFWTGNDKTDQHEAFIFRREAFALHAGNPADNDRDGFKPCKWEDAGYLWVQDTTGAWNTFRAFKNVTGEFQHEFIHSLYEYD
jgi:hypothetical protein